MNQSRIDEQRRRAGFLSVSELLEGFGADNSIPDPYAVLIAPGVAIGRGNRLYPGVVIEAGVERRIVIGDDNVFWPGSTLRAVGGGRIEIGSRNQFGPGGFTAHADGPEAVITIADRCRCLDGASLSGRVELGGGAQVLGPIAVQDCTLGGGGDYQTPDPDARGAVLKGCGRARGLSLGRGQVILGNGAFAEADLRPQSFYHRPGQAEHVAEAMPGVWLSPRSRF